MLVLVGEKMHFKLFELLSYPQLTCKDRRHYHHRASLFGYPFGRPHPRHEPWWEQMRNVPIQHTNSQIARGYQCEKGSDNQKRPACTGEGCMRQRAEVYGNYKK